MKNGMIFSFFDTFAYRRDSHSKEVSMDDVPISSTTMIELGLALSEKIEEPIVSENRAKANLPAIPETVPGANRLIADLIDLAALTDPNPDREVARDKMRGRLVRNAGKHTVHIATIEFEPEIQSNGDVHAVAWYSHIPGETKDRKIVPLIYAGPEFLKHIGNGKYISGGTFQCILFAPTSKNGFYKALPLGFADVKTIRTWNDIAERRNALTAYKDDPWPQIIKIDHELRRPGVRRVRFIPRFDHHANLQSGCSKRQLLGSHYGQKVYLAPKATVPEPDVIDGQQGFFEKHLFRVKRLKENSIEVVWLGNAKDIKIEDRISIEDVQNEMNPFVVLNTTPIMVDWKTIDQTTRRWVNGNRPYDSKNPIYVAALDLGLVHETDDAILQRAHLEQLWKEAVRLVRTEMIEAAKLAHHKLTIAPNRPSEKEIKGSETRIETLLLYLNEPEDAAAIWISRVFDKPFDPKSPFLMHLRAWIINTVVKLSTPAVKVISTREPSQFSIEIPELTPLPRKIELPTEPPPIPREISRPAFRPSDAFVAAPVILVSEEVHLDSDEIEEIFEAEATRVDHDSSEIGFVETQWGPTGENDILRPEDDPPPRMFAKRGSIMHTGELKVGYTDTDE